MNNAFELPLALRVGLVDSHAHLTRRTDSLIAERHSQPEVDVSADDYIGVLRAHGLDYGVLTAPSFYGNDNSLLLEGLRQYPDVLRGVVNADPTTSVQELRDWNEIGVVGVRFNMIRRKAVPDFASPEYQRLLEEIKTLGWHVEVYLESDRFQSVVAPILETGVTLVIDHFGYPVEADGIRAEGFRNVLRALREQNVYVKLSASYRIPMPSMVPVVEALKDARGIDSMVWASDWPWVSFRDQHSYSECMAWLVQWLPDPEERVRVLSDNARRLFRFP